MLITLGIIGIVAALTISNIVEHYRERQTVVRLKQTYSILNQAFVQMVEENGTLDTWYDESIDFLEQKLIEHLKVVRVCGSKGADYVSGDSADLQSCSTGLNSRRVFVLSNGTVIGIPKRITNSSESWAHCFYKVSSNMRGIYQGKCGILQVDINGKKGPNKDARDIFTFYLYTDSIIPLGAPMHTSSSWIEDFNRACAEEKELATCTAWVVYNSNMDYLHCPEKLGWGKAMKCKD